MAALPSAAVSRLRNAIEMSRTRLVRLITRFPADRLAVASRRVRGSLALRSLTAPFRWWLNRGHIRVAGGVGVGLRMWKGGIPSAHAHSRSIVRGQLEVPVQEALRRHLAPGDVFYDVGANVGFFSLIAARLVGPQGRVVAFEPVPANALAIRRNAAGNGFGGIDVLERAVFSASGRETVLLPGDTSWAHLEATGRHADTRASLSVEAVALDDLVGRREAPPPRVVKIDTEGAEIGVLEGMGEVLARHRPVVICELHGTNERFVELMEAAGYRVENLDGAEPVRSGPPSIHALAVPRSMGAANSAGL